MDIPTVAGSQKWRASRSPKNRRPPIRDREIRVAYESVHDASRCARGAGLQIVFAAVEAVARVADAPGERHHDREVGAAPCADGSRVAVARRDVERAACVRHLETDQCCTVTSDADSSAAIVPQHHQRLVIQRGAFGGVSAHRLVPIKTRRV